MASSGPQPIVLFTFDTPNGQKLGIMMEEIGEEALLARGPLGNATRPCPKSAGPTLSPLRASGLPYEVRNVDITKGDQVR